MKALKICIFTQQYGFTLSGIGTLTAPLINGLQGQGHRITVVCPSGKASGIRNDVLEIISFKNQSLVTSHARWFFVAWKYFFLYRSKLRPRGFDVLFFTDARESLFFPVRAAPPMIGIQNDYYFTGTDGQGASYRRMYRDWLLRICYRAVVHRTDRAALGKCTRIIAVSRAVHDAVRSAYGMSSHIVHPAIQQENGRAMHSETHRAVERNAILFTGGNFQRKGLAVLIRSLGVVAVKAADVRLTVVGGDTGRVHMERLAQTLGLGDRVEFTGTISNREVLQRLRRASLFVLPSFMEGFGLSLLEAMACGVPVIGSAVGGITEIITDGCNGLLVPPGDAAALAKQIIRLLENEEIRRACIANGYKTLGRFSPSVMVRRIDAVLREVCRK